MWAVLRAAEFVEGMLVFEWMVALQRRRRPPQQRQDRSAACALGSIGGSAAAVAAVSSSQHSSCSSGSRRGKLASWLYLSRLGPWKQHWLTGGGSC